MNRRRFLGLVTIPAGCIVGSPTTAAPAVVVTSKEVVIGCRALREVEIRFDGRVDLSREDALELLRRLAERDTAPSFRAVI